MTTVNIGILAHVDAGKTSLTERLLFDAGVLAELGSVDGGTTTTDSLAVERRRGITVRSAVVSFTVDGRTVNLIDTPGHPDFVAEVERVLRVLDGAVLVVSAVEGVQAQTRVLAGALARLRIPTVVFVNKIDRMGARTDALLADLERALGLRVVALNEVRDPGGASAEVVARAPADLVRGLTELLAEHSDPMLRSFLDGVLPPVRDCRTELAAQTRAALVQPVFFGSAITGAGVAEFTGGLGDLLAAGEPVDGGLLGTVFAVERGRSGERIAVVRLRSGTLRTRQDVPLHRRSSAGDVVERHAKVTALRIFAEGTTEPVGHVSAGDIAQVWGLGEVRIGEQLGSADGLPSGTAFDPPTLESIVHALRPGDELALVSALRLIAEQDPLIGITEHGRDGETSVLLYGEVQKEIIETRLAEEFAVPVTFSPTHVVHVERLAGTATAVERISRHGPNLFWATVGLRVEPGPPGSGIDYRLAVELGSLPLSFHTAIEETVHSTLRQGLYGWQVGDCVVTLTECGFAPPLTAAGDFRKLTPLVLMAALREAGTTVHEPVSEVDLVVPAAAVNVVFGALAGRGGIVHEAAETRLTGELAAGAVPDLQRRLPGLTSGEGALTSRFAGYRPVSGTPPLRPRSDGNPLAREEYLRHLATRGG